MEQKIKVFLDSNVLFSIAYTGREKSRSYLIYEIQAQGSIAIYLSTLVCAEATLNVKNKKPDAEKFLEELIETSVVLEDITARLNNPIVNKLPLNDRIILTTAIGNKMNCFLTGNTKDFASLYHKKIGDTIILKPVDFLYGKF
ncbi:MAG: PIN domain-containing protein [Nitrospirae bacterium]|nr:MAG: PIN domain-containing protein [Nitrospirota bacterium]